MRIPAAIAAALVASAAQAGPLIDGAEQSAVLMASQPQEAAPPAVKRAPFFMREFALRAAFDAAAGEDKVAASEALALFYEERGLYIESLSAIIEPDRPRARLLRARCAYSLGRFEATLEALDDETLRPTAAAKALRGMALARLGAYAKSLALLNSTAPANVPPRLRSEFPVLRADALLHANKIAEARAALEGSQALPEREYLTALIKLASGDERAARAVLKSLALGDGANGALARLQLAKMAKTRRAAALEAASLAWSGGAFEREALAASLSAETEPQSILTDARRLVERHPLSDRAAEARAKIASLLPTLMVRPDLAPRDSAKLFYENVDFAPPGADGDRLIREVAEKLAALDLATPAAELLEHQVFKRLRGAERSTVALRLAELYLDEGRPLEALRVIRSTRIAGLPAAVGEQRLLVEAKALELSNAEDAAIALLADAKSKTAQELRGDIEWRRGHWANAAAGYRAALAQSQSSANAAARQTALRAAAAYLQAGDEAGLQSFVAEIAPRLVGTREGEMLETLGSDEGAQQFMSAYRRAFEPARQPEI